MININELKVGDKIRRINHGSLKYTPGKVYEVMKYLVNKKKKRIRVLINRNPKHIGA
jgi:hypothetical protein